MGECFWAPESIVGLTRDCPVAPLGNVLSFCPPVDEDGRYEVYEPGDFLIAHVTGYPYDPDTLTSPAFQAKLDEAVYDGAVTGYFYIGGIEAPAASGWLGGTIPNINFTDVDLPFSMQAEMDLVAPKSVGAGVFYVRVVVGGATFFGICSAGNGGEA